MSPLLRFWRNTRRATATRRAPASRRAARFRPRLEPLECRLAPATLTWTGAVSELWSDYRNWAGGITPSTTPEADDLIFPRAVVPHKVSNNDLGAVISSITFDDSGYRLIGGDILFGFEAPLRIGTIISKAPSGTNTIE